MSAGDMATLLEVDRGEISRFENDKKRPRRAIVMAYALACDVPIEWLEEVMPPLSGTTPEYSHIARRHLSLVKLKDVA